jgi:hypothetical protein
MPFRSRPEALHQREEQLVADLRQLGEQAKDIESKLAHVRALLASPDNQPALDDLAAASPCDARWEAMAGDERVRHCGACRKNVYNLEALTRREARALLIENEEPCIRLRRRPDGTVITGDCPEGVRTIRRRRVAGAALLVGVSAGLVTAQASRVTMGAMQRLAYRDAPASYDGPQRRHADLDRLGDAFGPDDAGLELGAMCSFKPVRIAPATQWSSTSFHRKLDRATLDAILAQTAALPTPHLTMEHRGEARLWRLGDVTPGSTVANLGLQSGDLLVSLNGHPLADADQALAAYSTLRAPVSRIILELERNDRPVFLTYSVE